MQPKFAFLPDTGGNWHSETKAYGSTRTRWGRLRDMLASGALLDDRNGKLRGLSALMVMSVIAAACTARNDSNNVNSTGRAGGTASGGASGKGGNAGGGVDAGHAGTSGAPASAGNGDGGSAPPPAVLPVPTPDQAARQRLGLTALFHFGLPTFTGSRGGDGTASPTVFTPSGLDPTQWVSVLQGAGFKEGILVVKHHDGFCLWPTTCSSYSVAASPWMGGKGDVVKAYTDAAHAAGFRVGIYLSPYDTHPEDDSTAPGYAAKFQCMLNELLTNYGVVDELWFDGNSAPNFDWGSVAASAKQLQPHLLVAITGPDIRWVGNEDGIAPLGETSVQTGNPSLGQPSGLTWYPSESDVSIRPGWFYYASEDNQLKSLSTLVDLYFQSVGRNSLLVLNVPPNQTGVLAGTDVTRLGQLGTTLSNLFATNLAAGKAVTADSVWQAQNYAGARAVDGNLDTFWAAAAGKTSGRLEIDLGTLQSIQIVDVSEPIALGERSSKYHVEIQASGATTWTTVASGTVIGARNLIRLSPAVSARKIALVLEQARGVPAIAEFGVY
jgi:alpha-L-fucosidase